MTISECMASWPLCFSTINWCSALYKEKENLLKRHKHNVRSVNSPHSLLRCHLVQGLQKCHVSQNENYLFYWGMSSPCWGPLGHAGPCVVDACCRCVPARTNLDVFVVFAEFCQQCLFGLSTQNLPREHQFQIEKQIISPTLHIVPCFPISGIATCYWPLNGVATCQHAKVIARNLGSRTFIWLTLTHVHTFPDCHDNYYII